MAQFGNSVQPTTPIILNLIIINVLVYLAQKFIPGATDWGSLHYFQSALFKPHQLITSVFMHDPDSYAHILFNMFALWMFGSILERFWGSKKFLIFYLICGIGASIFIELTIPFSASQSAKSALQDAAQNTPGMLQGLSVDQLIAQNRDMYLQLISQAKEQYSALGASGAIMGVMAAFAYLFPNTKLFIMFIPIPVAAKYVIPGFILFDLFGGLYQFRGDNIGHFAHLGGALIGIILVLFWNRTNKQTFY